MKKVLKAWAIKGTIRDHKPPDYFMGIFNFIGSTLEPCQDGMRTALFRTRKEARAEAKPSRWNHARAVKVEITIKEIP